MRAFDGKDRMCGTEKCGARGLMVFQRLNWTQGRSDVTVPFHVVILSDVNVPS
jgi:hypothetical protein